MDKRIKYLIPIVLFSAAILMAYISADKLFHFQATTSDENAYVFQSKLFLKGKIYGVPHPLKHFFDAEQVVSTGKWFSRYSPGHSLLILPGVFLNLKNLMPFIYSALTILLVYLILIRLTKNTLLSFIGAAAMILSPFFIVMSGTCLSHTSGALCVILYVYILYKDVDMKMSRLSNSAIMGFLLGLLFTIRQYSCLLVAFPFVAYYTFLCVKDRKFKNYLYFVVGSIPPLAVLFIYNYACTGNPLTQTYTYYDPTQKLGFGIRYFGGYDFTPQTAYKFLRINIALLNERALGIPFVPIMIASMIISRNDIWKWLLASGSLFLMGGYFFFYYPGIFFIGPNYYYEAFPLMIILLFRNLRYLYFKGRYFIIATAVAAIAAYGYYYPKIMKEVSKGIAKHADELVAIRDAFDKNNIHNAVVIVENDTSFHSWYAMLINNSPFFDNDVILARNWYRTNPLLYQYFRDRKFYKVHFTGRGGEAVVKEIEISKPFNMLFRIDDDFKNNIGKKVYLPGTDKFIVYARKGTDRAETMLYGPYWQFPRGEYVCDFYIKADRMSNDAPVVKIDVSTDSGKTVLAERVLTGLDFKNKKGYLRFQLKYFLDNVSKIETRMYYYGNANVSVKQIRIEQMP